MVSIRADLRLGIAQTTSSHHFDENIHALWRAGKAAHASRCHLLVLPEMSGFLAAQDDHPPLSKFYLSENDPYLGAAKECAKTFKLWLHIGSTPIRGNDKLLNHSVLINSLGETRCVYNKIHLFDYRPDHHQPLLESNRFSAGDEGALVQTDWGLWGLCICYDLRFPNLFRDYAKRGARLIFVPSAFTLETGRDHWMSLLRARAIENGCWIVAAAQVGHHSGGRETYGHSMLISPWGRVVLELGGDATEFAAQTLNLDEVENSRRQIDSLNHGRPYSIKCFDDRRHVD